MFFKCKNEVLSLEILRVDIKQAGYLEKPDAIVDICFSLKRGETIGLIGPNGAGKSTTIKVIAGLLPEIKGAVEFQSRNFAYIPDQPVFYDELTLWEHLQLAGAVNNIEDDVVAKKGKELLEAFGMVAQMHHFPSSFSKGMLQKMMIILGLLVEPDLYIIDEPFVGLDPRATMKFLQFLQEKKNQGACMLVSTHQLDLAERICDYIILMMAGRIIARGSLKDIQSKCGMPGATLFDCFNSLLESDV